MDNISLERRNNLKKTDTNVLQVTSEHLCHSCGACSAVCKQDAIRFSETVGGYLFPAIDSDTCTHCGLCYKVCPGIHFGKSLTANMPEDPFVGQIQSCHVGKAVNNTIFENSQSGGVTTALLVHLMVTGQISGAIVASMSTIPPRGKALFAKSVDDFLLAQKSKYVPIPMLSTIPSHEGPLAFVGLPCHMHGLNNLFDYYPQLKSKVLIKIGLVCDRVLTNAVVDFLAWKANCSPVKSLVFRDKNKPCYPGNVVVQSTTGREAVLDASLRMSIKDLFTPARCRLCFDKLNVFADVVLGDPHGLKGIDQKRGESLVIIRTARGKELVSAAAATGTIDLREVNKNDMIEGQNIQKKRMEWAGYVKGLTQLGGSLPEYCEAVLKHANAPEEEIHKYKKSFLYSTGLDRFVSRKALLISADSLLRKRKAARMWKEFLDKTKKYMRKPKTFIRMILK